MKQATDKKNAHQQSPWDAANALSKYALAPIFPLVRKARRVDLTSDDLLKAPLEDDSNALGQKLQRNFEAETRTRTKPSFARALLKTFWPDLLRASFFDLISKCVFLILQTISLGQLVEDIGIYQMISRADTAAAAQPLSGANSTQLQQVLSAQQVAPNTTIDSYNATQLHDMLQVQYFRILRDGLALVVFLAGNSCSMHPFQLSTCHIGMKCRVASCNLIYKKALRLSQASLAQASAGKMVNLLSNDVNRFDQVLQLLPFLVTAPIQTVVVGVVMTKVYLGFYPTMAGITAIVTFALCQSVTAQMFSKLRLQTALRTDERVRIFNEVIQSIKVIKMYAWERPFGQLIERARELELAKVAQTAVFKAFNMALFFASSKASVFCILITYVTCGGTLTPEVMFVALGLCNAVRITVALLFANAVTQCSEALVSCDRINEFLLLSEVHDKLAGLKHDKRPRHCYSTLASGDGSGGGGGGDYSTTGDSAAGDSAPAPIIAQRLYATWTVKEQMIVRNLTMTVADRELVLVVGRVGAGKSSLLMALLGELPAACGRLEVNGRVSYAAQEPWIFSGTVRDNILFGEMFDETRYSRVVDACSLVRDFELLGEGDLTRVGEKGVALSGGQKARINLARALYRDADIYLLDDPLSAVDTHVARHIFNNCFDRSRPTSLLRNKTVLLTTHQLQFLRFASKVLLVEAQTTPLFGTPSDLLASDAFKLIGFSRAAFEDALNTTVSAFDRRQDATDAAVVATDRAQRDKGRAQHTAPANCGAKNDTDPDDKPNDESALTKPGGQSPYAYFIHNAFSRVAFALFVGSFPFVTLLYQSIDLNMSLWIDGFEQTKYRQPEPDSFYENLPVDRAVLYYFAMVLLSALSILLMSNIFLACCIQASRNFHAKIMHSLMSAQLAFYETTPVGVILNRVSRDLGFVDSIMPPIMLEIMLIFAYSFIIIIIQSFINPLNGALALVLLVAAVSVRKFALDSITNLKRLEGVTRSPVFSHIATSLNGIVTIRAFNSETALTKLFDEQQNAHSDAWFSFVCASRWTSQAMDWVGISFVALVVAVCVTKFSIELSSASLIGLVLSQSLSLPSALNQVVKSLVELESQMTSVERVRELAENLESEQVAYKLQPLNTTWSRSNSTGSYASAKSIWPVTATVTTVHDKPPTSYSCAVRFYNVSMRYSADDSPVLKALNLAIMAGEKVGIVGRTGAGKSSIVSALFRLYDFEGRIELNGRDTKRMSLSELRRSMSIIPQDPVLFGGTVRKNLDPFDEYDDEVLWRALEAVHLRLLLTNQPNGLESIVSEGGANYSVGQRQLICLARAIVRRNKILVLDEATANVDPETDAFIQRTIAQQFYDCTVLTIAHRLITIVDSDRVLVMDRGEVREFAEPHELLKIEDGVFRSLVDNSAQQAERLRTLIENAHSTRHTSAHQIKY